MLKVDEFESVFRSAIKETYQHREISISSALLVTDLDKDSTRQLDSQVQAFCQSLISTNESTAGIKWHAVNGDEFKTAEDLLSIANNTNADLIVTYRNLHSKSWRHPYSLGEHLDVLLQKTDTPVLVIPHPDANYAHDEALNSCTSVMVVTDHLVNDHRLVQYGVSFVQEGTVYLSHIEDQQNFDRVIDAIGKIPSIETDDAKIKLSTQLLKEPTEYIQSVKTELDALNKHIEVNPIVEFGHQLKDYIKHIEKKRIDLLVINTKDGDQAAMHGLAYPMAVEIRQIPLLML